MDLTETLARLMAKALRGTEYWVEVEDGNVVGPVCKVEGGRLVPVPDTALAGPNLASYRRWAQTIPVPPGKVVFQATPFSWTGMRIVRGEETDFVPFPTPLWGQPFYKAVPKSVFRPVIGAP